MNIRKRTGILIILTLLKINNSGLASPYNHFIQWPAKNTSVTGGWLETTWHQEAPYNQFCPVDSTSGVRSLTGCMATAVAQVLNYHGFADTPGLDKRDHYVTRDLKIQIDDDSSRFDFPSFDQLNHNCNLIKTRFDSENLLTENEIASLGFICGILLKTNYSSSLSGISHEVSPDIFNRFGYESAVIEENESDFWRTLKQTIINGYPAVLVLPDHAVVADGYNTNGEYHLNFGWGDKNPSDIEKAWFHLDPENNTSLLVNTDDSIVQIYPRFAKERLCVDDTWVIETERFNTWSQPVAFEISNLSDEPLRVDYILLPSTFSASWDNVAYSDSLSGISIETGQSKTVYMQYKPTQMAPVSGDGFIAYAGQKSVALVEVSGVMKPQKGTTVSSREVSGTWTKSESPYHILNNISVSPNSRLKIESGVQLFFWNHSRLYVGADAQLIARGSETDSIQWMPVNKEQGWGGIVIERSGSDDTLAYCQIRHAKGNTFGGALWVIDSETVIQRCYLGYNSAEFGGGLYIWGGHPEIQNTIISHNQADYGGGICAEVKAHLTLMNVTLADNKARTGGGIHLSLNNQLEIRNSILWQNQAEYGHTLSFSEKDKINICYSDIDKKTENWQYHHDGIGGSINWEDGVISQDPEFLNSFYHLSDSSACIDRGDPSNSFNDLEDKQAPGSALFPAMGGLRNDMGAYGGGSHSFFTAVERITFATDAFFLFRNYPNPFNPETQIQYALPKSVHVSIYIYDIMGREVMQLVNEVQERGIHTVKCDAASLSTGIYVYQLLTPEFQDSRKMMVIK